MNCNRCQNRILPEDIQEHSLCRICRAFVEYPDSIVIAALLNADDVEICVHGRNPCILRCGVERPWNGDWKVIPHEDRVKWLTIKRDL